VVRSNGGRIAVVVAPTASAPMGATVLQAAVDEVADVIWVNDQRLILIMAGGSVFAVDRDGSAGTALIRSMRPANFVVLWRGEEGSDDIIVGRRDFDSIDGHVRLVWPYRLNTRTRSLASLLDTTIPEYAREWVFDANARPRAYTAVDKGRRRVYYREADEKKWRLLGDFDAVTDEGFFPWLIGYDGALYVTESKEQDASSLYRYDFNRGRVEDKPMVHIEGFDFAGSVEIEKNAKKYLNFQ
jgi:hypothetical protein